MRSLTRVCMGCMLNHSVDEGLGKIMVNWEELLKLYQEPLIQSQVMLLNKWHNEV
jgi:hypothetical protein